MSAFWNALRSRPAGRAARAVLAAAAVAASVAAPVLSETRVAAADQVPVLVAQHGTHSIYVSYDEPYDVENLNTYWDFIPLDGMCGFAGTELILSNMTETYFLQDNPETGSFTGMAKILDETFVLTQFDTGGNIVEVYEGTGDEYAQFRGTGANGYGADQGANLRVMFRGASDDGDHLSFSIVMRLRFDRQSGELERFVAEVSSCHVH